GIVGIDLDGVDPAEVDRIQKRLAPGAHNAGQLTLVGTGPGGVTYVDTSARPREMAYETLSGTAKNEILSAFGVPESIVGHASERTYANADREEYNFWAHTELPHLNLVASAFDPDLSDDWVIRFDTSRIQALEFPRREARKESREEFDKGLITIDEYRVAAGRKPFGTPQSRALWISPQKAPVPANDQDAAALGLGPEPGAEAIPSSDPNAALPTADGDPSAAAAVAQARELGTPPSAAVDVALARGEAPLELPTGTEGSAADAVAAARAQSIETGPGAAADDVAAARATLAQPEDGPAADDVAAARAQLEAKSLTPEGFEVTDADFDALALAVQAALTALLARQQGVILARLRAPKTRKHTRFWEATDEHDTRGGNANIDEDRVVSAARWAEETTHTLAPILQQVATATASKLGQAVAGTAAVPPAAGAAALVNAMYAGEAVTALLGNLAEELHSLQTTPEAELTLEDLERTVTRFYTAAAPALVARVAETCAVSTINGAADAAAESAGPGVIRTWITRQDDRVRPAHKALHGKTLPAGSPYEIAGAQLRYPGDPFAPIALTVNCRCRLHYDTDPQE
ncbi:MAG: phage portal protein, partial [Streptomyces sp.]|nr:phage portal protein [Streptomyces sp.]